MQKHFSLGAFFISCLVIIAMALWYPKWEKPGTEATLSWDVMGYYLYLPAYFIYDDLTEVGFKDEVIEKYGPTAGFYQAFKHEESGNYVMKYSIGLAVLYSPFFLLGHAYALISDYPPDGFSLPYQMAISWGSLFIAFLGLWFCRSILRRYFSEMITGISLLLVATATNYLNYTAIDGAMGHNWIFTLFALLIWLSIKWHEKPTFSKSIGIGLCIGLAALSRPTDVLAFLIPILWGIENKASFINRLSFLQTHWQKLAIAILTVALVGSIQLFYWKSITGDWIVYSYEDQGFSWFKPHVKNVLISYRKGWLRYTPIMLLALIGFIPLYKKYRFLFWTSFLFFLLNFYIVSAWDVWAYGGAFGQRALIQSYTVLLFPLAAFWEAAFQTNWKKWLSLAFAVFCIWLNIFQTYQAHGHGFEVEAMTKAYYWRIFANANPTDLDRKLLDTREDFQEERRNIQQVYLNDFENPTDTINYSNRQAKSGTSALLLQKSEEFSPAFIIKIAEKSPKWIRVSADFYSPLKEWSIWNMHQLIVRFEKGDKVIKNRIIRIHRQLGERQWQANWSDMRIPKEDFDHVKIYFWNAGSGKDVFVDNLKVEIYEE